VIVETIATNPIPGFVNCVTRQTRTSATITPSPSQIQSRAQAKEIQADVRYHRPADRPRAPGYPAIGKPDRERAQHERKRPAGHRVAMNRQRRQVPDRKTQRWVKPAPQRAARKSLDVGAAPQHFFQRGVGQRQGQ
jgi:hypothetical protein